MEDGLFQRTSHHDKLRRQVAELQDRGGDAPV
jgi:hypothetical protein